MESKSWKSKGKRLFEKEKSGKKPLQTTVSVAMKGKRSKNTLPRECSFKGPSSKSVSKKTLPEECSFKGSSSKSVSKKTLPEECSFKGPTSKSVSKKTLPEECSFKGPTSKSVSKKTLPEECSFKGPSSKSVNHPPPPCSNTCDTKKVLSNWKQMKLSKKRKEALVNLDLIKNTAGFNDNMDSTRDFQNLIGCKYVSSAMSRDEFFTCYPN
ncbi:unnamed protein product [Lupinus luteus]|uniref:Uncharacterized protein n=1 Tax=Lupinus luteus TaxID=3873 RepID=A0AAV1X6W9_LUPLU